MIRYLITSIIVATILNQISAYRILGVFPLNGKSHDMIFEGLVRGLAKRGHKVDVVTHFPLKNPPKNYKTLIDLSPTMTNLINNFTVEFVTGMADEVTHHVATVRGNELCELLGLKEMQELIKNPPKDPPYDVFITEAFGANCFMGIGHHFNIPIIAVSSAVEYPWVSDFTGNNDNPAIVPNALFMAFGKMNFWERIKNTLIYHNEIRIFHSLTEHSQTESMRKYLNPNIPNIREVERSVAVTLVNSHPILYGVKPVLPTLVQIGGLHVEENVAKLPPDLKKWMDESKNGVVYFTFGSMVITETLPTNTLKIFFNSFAKIAPIRVLMKIADKTKLTIDIPQNVLSLPWIPQQPVLAHKNTRAFITHGGLMGCIEALYNGVPMIGVPLFADQPRNVESFVAKNMSIKLLYKDITEKKLNDALHSVLHDPKYKKSMEHYSKLFRDRPMSAMDTAVYWIEYVVRNGPNELRSPALDLTWWQLASLDVYGFLILVFISFKFVTFLVLKFIVKKIFRLLSANNADVIKKRK